MSSSALAAGLRNLRGKLAAHECHDDSDEQLLHAFTSRRDDSAFAVLVRRYGPMVLNVCRRVLGHDQDAEDAFQATFLVLARKASSLRNKAMLGGFLHGTAYRAAMKAKQAAARRRDHEGKAPVRAMMNPNEELSWREVKTLLDEEIGRLPEIYRVVFVLFYLQDLSREETARRLGLKEVTVAKRLAEARKRLQGRLARRGIELTAVVAACAVATPPASAVPAGLMTSTTQAALAMTTGQQLAAVASGAITELVKSVTTALIVRKTKMVALFLAAAALLAGAGAWACRSLALPKLSERPDEPATFQVAAAINPQKPQEAKSNDVQVSGRVLDPDGKPVNKAKILFVYGSTEAHPRKVWATSAADGRFDFAVPRELMKNTASETPWADTHVMAAAEGYGCAVTRLGKPGATDLTLRLVPDDVPIRGRILDLQGKPVAGVRVRIDGYLYAPEKGDLSAWLDFLTNSNRDARFAWWSPLMELGSTAFDLLIPPVTTGGDGRFCIQGIGRERAAQLRIDGPTVATQRIYVMTRRHDPIRLPESGVHPKDSKLNCLGAVFDVVAGPTRLIEGVVRDKDSGKPLADVIVESKKIAGRHEMGAIRTTTDENGRYRLVGLPKGKGNEITARTDELPYLASGKAVGDPLGIEPITVDFALKRGVWVTGRVTDQETGKSVAAAVEYFCFNENPNSEGLSHRVYPFNVRWTPNDGSFRIPALPGRGVIAVRANQDRYIMGVGTDRITEGYAQRTPDMLNTTPYYCIPTNYHTLVGISPKPSEETITCDVALIRGRSLKGKVLDPDGKPLDRVRAAGLKFMGYWENSSGSFTVESLQPNKTRVLQFVHDGKKLAGFLILQGDEKAPVTVRMQSWGTLTGRLLTLEGDPVAGARVGFGALNVVTGKEGRFCIEGLAPGLKYELFLTKDSYVRELAGKPIKDLTVTSSETRDLGDLKVKPVE